MSAADVIEQKCQKYPGLRYERKGAAITVFPRDETGFPVSYARGGDNHVVSFLGWHEEFSAEEEALNCFAFGLSKECRLQVRYKGDRAYKWIVELKTAEGVWEPKSEVGLLFFPYWRKSRIVYLENGLI
jgi:hypothetical protein